MAQTMSFSDWQELKPAGFETPVAHYNVWEGDAPSLLGQAQQVVLALFSRLTLQPAKIIQKVSFLPSFHRIRWP